MNLEEGVSHRLNSHY